ncbi:MAG: hypothetical protein R3211_11995 [Balneolaceae bacterium]|nr:hypothetical protein [Balneolaceae bacterium]
MIDKKDTKLEVFGFGENASDKFYALVNLKKSPDGIDLKKLSLTDPRKFDDELNRMGCILLLRADEVEELIERGEIEDSDLHQSIYDLAVKEGVIQ